MLGAAVGDAVHNLRTSLDLMASELARLNGKSDSNVYFPFASSEGALSDQIRKKNFLDCGEDAVKILKTFAPYKGGNLRLRALHDLDIQDKHTALIPTFATHDFSFDATVEFQLNANIAIPVKVSKVDFTFPPGYPLETVSIVESLKDMVEIVDGILKVFEAMVDARGI